MTLPDMHSAEAIPDTARAEIEQLLQSGDLFRYTAPENAPVTLLEREFADLLGSKYALAVSSCSAALFLSLKALGLPRDARVLIPGFTFAAVPSSVIHADCVPVLCEVGENYRIDMGDFAAKLPSCQAVIISHMRGHTSDMDAIMALCNAAGVPVIASDFPAWRAVVDGCGCGRLADPLDPASIADAMQWMLEHPEETDAMGRRGREAVETQYNWEQESRTLLDLYAALAEGRPVA